MRPVRWSAIGLAIALLAGCGGSGGAVETVSPSSVPASSGPVLPGTEIVPRSCIWRWFDRWDVELDVPSGVAPGTELTVQATIFEGDVSSLGARGQVAVAAPGRQVVQLSVPRPTWFAPDVVRFSTRELAPSAGSMCDILVESPAATGGGVLDLGYDIQAPPSDGTPIGDLVAQVRTVDDPAFLLGAWQWLLADSPTDELYLARGLVLDTVEVRRDATCLAISTGYRTGGASVSVTQEHGCMPALVLDPSAVVVPGDHWMVTVVGATSAAVAADLTVVAIPGGESADGPAVPTPDEWLDGYFLVHDDVVELARFPWGGGKVAVVHRDTQVFMDAYIEPLRAGAAANYSSTAQGCREYTVGVTGSFMGAGEGSEPGGYAWFVARDPGTRFLLSAAGLPAEVPLQPAPSGEHVGFLDLALTPLELNSITAVDASGATLPCTQT